MKSNFINILGYSNSQSKNSIISLLKKSFFFVSYFVEINGMWIQQRICLFSVIQTKSETQKRELKKTKKK